jgi:hypothetical protein
VADEVQAHVAAVFHALEDRAHLLHVRVRDVRLARLEVDRRQQVLHLDGPHVLLDHFLALGALLHQRGEAVLVELPRPERRVGIELLLDRLAERRRRDDLLRARLHRVVFGRGCLRQDHGRQQQAQREMDEWNECSPHVSSRSAHRGAPVRQKISVSTVRS